MAESETRRAGRLSLPRQARSRERLERILEAAEEVISEVGFDAATVKEIMLRAQAPVGIFYTRFRSKEDLLHCVFERFVQSSIATTDKVLDPEVWIGKNADEIVESTVPILVDVYRHRRGLIRAFLLKASTDVEFGRQAHRPERHVFEKMRQLLLDRVTEFDHPQPERAIGLALQMLRSVLNTLVLFAIGDRAGYSLDDPALAEDLAAAFVRQLGARPTK